MLYRVRDMYLH